MKRKDDVFHYFGQILTVFGLTVVFISVFSYFFGEDGKVYSSFFELGNEGLTMKTLAQLLMMSVLITTLRFILFTDGMISRISLTIRILLMFFLVILMIALFAFMFGWFPVNMPEAWGAFFLCFAVCAFASSYIMAWKTDRENKEMEEALKRLKEEHEENEEQHEQHGLCNKNL